MLPTAAGAAFLARARRALDKMAAATTDSSTLNGATVAREVHTIIGLAASGVGVGLGLSRVRACGSVR
nr:hypothetical protein [Streptomyces griseofuscus]